MCLFETEIWEEKTVMLGYLLMPGAWLGARRIRLRGFGDSRLRRHAHQKCRKAGRECMQEGGITRLRPLVGWRVM